MIARAREVLDQAAPLAGASHAAGDVYTRRGRRAAVTLTTAPDRAGRSRAVRRLSRRAPARHRVLLLHHNGLHIEIVIDRAHPIGKADPAGIADVILEAALTTIKDCEDFDRRGRRRGQGRGLPQLARPDAAAT